MRSKYALAGWLTLWIFCIGRGQDFGSWIISGSLQRNSINPGAAMTSSFNAALANYHFHLSTDGPAIADITSLNASGNRYLDFSRFNNAFNEINNIQLNSRLQSVGLGIRLRDFTILAGHSFNVAGEMSYTGALANLAARGNAAFIGQTIEIGPSFRLFAWNELYVGLQHQAGKLGVGGRVKFLFGTAGVQTERNSIRFTTDEEYYQLRFQNDYLIRSSALFKINTVEEIDFSYPDFTFENLFYNNFGIALDLGLTYRLTDKTELGLSLLNMGKINWDFFPRAFSSKGNFSFEGVDVVKYISDSTGINIADTLIGIFSFDETIEPFSSRLPSSLLAGFSHRYSDLWSFHGLARVDEFDFQNRSALTVGAVHHLGIINIGLNYTIRKNNYALFGLSAYGKLGPFTAYLHTEHIPAWISPLRYKSFNIALGGGISF
ncbi:MAG: hypothetical protein IPM26_09680 [Saprospiraceae bacterium]|nr:hypothetical protein [Saprospiraceae bacterium]